MNNIGIIQPGRLGDIIICLPIAKYYFDRGYQVYWPIFSNLISNFIKTVNYVNFIPITNNVYKCVQEANERLKSINNIDIIDIAATFPGSECTDEYVKCGDGYGSETFDMFKYRKSQVPFEHKWNLSIKVDEEEENQIYITEAKNLERYVVTGLNHSQGRANINIETDKSIVEINEKYCIFSWLKTLKNATNIVLVDSAMANFVEQMNLTNSKILVSKPNQPRPFFKNNWKII